MVLITLLHRSQPKLWGESIHFKISGFNPGKSASSQRFKGLCIKETKELVSIGLPQSQALKSDTAPHLSPKEWQELLERLSSEGHISKTLTNEVYPIKECAVSMSEKIALFVPVSQEASRLCSWTFAMYMRATLDTFQSPESKLCDHHCDNSPISPGKRPRLRSIVSRQDLENRRWQSPRGVHFARRKSAVRALHCVVLA